MSTPTQPAAAPAAPAEPGVAAVPANEGAAFLREMITAGQQPGGGQRPPVAVQPAPYEPVQPAPSTQPPVAPPVQPPATPPVVQPPVAPPQPPAPPPPIPATIDFSQRYSGQNPEDPAAQLVEAPALPPEQQVTQPQNLNEQQNHAWAAIRAQSNANRRAAEEYRTKYNQVVELSKKFQDEKAGFAQQLAAKDAEIAKLQDDIGRVDLARSQAFRDKYDAPIQQVHAEMVTQLKHAGYPEEDADSLSRQIMSTPREQLPDLLKDLPAHMQGILMVKAEAADGLMVARDQAIEDWRTSAEGLAAVQERGAGILTAQHVDKMVQRATEIVHAMPLSTMPPAYQVTDPMFAADRTAKEQAFRSWVLNAPEEQKYAAMLEGFMAPKTYEMLEQTMRENHQLRSVLMARGMLSAPPVVSAPSVPSAPAPAPAPVPAPTVKDNGFSEAPGVHMAEGFVSEILSPLMGAEVPGVQQV